MFWGFVDLPAGHWGQCHRLNPSPEIAGFVLKFETNMFVDVQATELIPFTFVFFLHFLQNLSIQETRKIKHSQMTQAECSTNVLVLHIFAKFDVTGRTLWLLLLYPLR